MILQLCFLQLHSSLGEIGLVYKFMYDIFFVLYGLSDCISCSLVTLPQMVSLLIPVELQSNQTADYSDDHVFEFIL